MTAFTTATLATELDTTPRTLRRFLRAESQGVGKGSRYSLELNKRDITTMTKKFRSWAEADEAAKAAKKVTEVESDITTD